MSQQDDLRRIMSRIAEHSTANPDPSEPEHPSVSDVVRGWSSGQSMPFGRDTAPYQPPHQEQPVPQPQHAHQRQPIAPHPAEDRSAQYASEEWLAHPVDAFDVNQMNAAEPPLPRPRRQRQQMAMHEPGMTSKSAGGGDGHGGSGGGGPTDGGNPKQGRKKPPQKKKKLRQNKIVRSLQLSMTLFFFGALALAAFFMYSRYQIDRPGPLTERTIFEVEKGYGLNAIASQLKKAGIIHDKRIFALHAIASKKAKKLKAGKYAIPKAASMHRVLNILVQGKAIFYQVTIPEGRTSQQAVAILNAHPQLVGTITEVPPEGSLMPETYRFTDNTNRNQILQQMIKAQSDHLAAQWALRQPDLPLKTPQEALILASIVEKETGQASERPRVAGVFINRLRRGMKLQSDPTIIYGLVGGAGKLGHPLRRSEMNKQTAYNTYQIKGLPPTPIANPGRKAIEAVLNPADTKDLYFVADGTGGHAFATNIRGHNNNVQNWRRIEAERRLKEKRLAAERKLAEKIAAATKAKKSQPVLQGVGVVEPKGESEPVAGAAAEPSVWTNQIPLPVRKPR